MSEIAKEQLYHNRILKGICKVGLGAAVTGVGIGVGMAGAGYAIDYSELFENGLKLAGASAVGGLLIRHCLDEVSTKVRELEIMLR